MARYTVEQVNKKIKLLGPYGPNDIFKDLKGYIKVTSRLLNNKSSKNKNSTLVAPAGFYYLVKEKTNG